MRRTRRKVGRTGAMLGAATMIGIAAMPCVAGATVEPVYEGGHYANGHDGIVPSYEGGARPEPRRFPPNFRFPSSGLPAYR
jgi:hypothetical protein